MDGGPHPAELADYPVITEIPVQWGDQDAFGHVNNTVHIRWFESARIDYMLRIGLDAARAGGVGPILATITCHYRRQINWPDRVLIGTRVARIGKSSLTIAHAVYSTEQQALVADGDSVIVAFDYDSQQSIRVPDEIREAIRRIQGEAE